ncbi:hypothetical protein HHI36_019835 [Cryptolaemus montrouzieri]|uniref:MADF domain-containing protein n=1 Tax=Cryptolaemus montrouzieri TaxID=559131 RepID=A0ABD2N8K1_9CUCU
MSRKQNQVMVDFFSIHQSKSCLWQVEASEYHDNAKKDAANNKLVEKLEKLEPGATKKSVVAKINVRKERKKVEALKKSGASADSIYKPVFWYYDLFDFLQDQDTPETSCSNLDSENDEVTNCYLYNDHIS